MKVYQLFLVLVILTSCVRLPFTKNLNDFIFKIEGNPVREDEFLYNLNKNNYEQDSTISRDEIKEYLDLYINFKLKVYEARQLGLDTTESFKNEYDKYINQLADSFMKDDSIVDVLVKEAYEHLNTEINASHILIKVENPANPEDTLRAYRKIYQIYELANSGNDFNKLASEYSEDPSVKINEGNLGYFTGLQMVYPFEKAAYSTAIGHISNPFKTRFGYHILKVNDKRSAGGKIQVAHIMLRLNDTLNQNDSSKIKDQINAIYDSLRNGGDWEYFCQKYSQDLNTKNNGGLLQPFETGRVIPSFSEPAFALINPGDISQPILTSYGWHIIKLIDKISLQPFEELKEELTGRIKQDSRSYISKEMLIGKLKEENGFSINKGVSDKILEYADSTLLKSQWSFDDSNAILDSTLFSIQEANYSVKKFFNYVLKNQKPMRNVAPGYYFNQLFIDFSNQEVLNYEKNHLADKYFDYRMLSREYEEGILLFDIMDQKIWSYALQDSSGLTHFYELNEENYKWDTRLKATIFRSRDIQTIEEVRNLLQEPYYYLSKDSISFDLGQDGTLPTRNLNQIDSLYQIAAKNENWFVEFTPSEQHDPQQILSIFKQKNYNMDEFIVNSYKTGIDLLKLISISKKDLDKSISDKVGVNLQIDSGIYQKGDNEIIDLIQWKEGIHDLSIEDDEYVVYVEKVLPPMNQLLEEVKGKVISDYQNYLDKQWINNLRQKYDVQINNHELNNIIKRFEKL